MYIYVYTCAFKKLSFNDTRYWRRSWLTESMPLLKLNLWLESELNFLIEISDLQLNLLLESMSEAGALQQQNSTQPQQLAPVQPQKVDEPQFVCDIWPAFDKIYVSGYEVPTCPYVFFPIFFNCLLPCCARLFLFLHTWHKMSGLDIYRYRYIYRCIYLCLCVCVCVCV
jgi:hypothetical protein